MTPIKIHRVTSMPSTSLSSALLHLRRRTLLYFGRCGRNAIVAPFPLHTAFAMRSGGAQQQAGEERQSAECQRGGKRIEMRPARAQQKISPGCGCGAQERIANRARFFDPCARRPDGSATSTANSAMRRQARLLASGNSNARFFVHPSRICSQAAIHAGADHSLAHAEAQDVAGALHSARQSNIFEQISGDGGMPANSW